MTKATRINLPEAERLAAKHACEPGFALLQKLIDERRAMADPGDDFLGTLVKTVDDKGDRLDDYESRVNAMLTTRAKGEFKQSFPAFEKVYQQGKAVGTGELHAAGVEDIDQDSATVLVIHDRTVKSSFGDQKQYLRWSVQLDKVDGAWKIDKFEDGS